MKLVVVQPLLPHYSIAFFNRVVDMHPDVELVLLADIETREALNQYRPQDCHFTVRHLPSVQRKGLIFRPGLMRLLRQENADVTVFNANPREVSQLCAMVMSRLLDRRFTAWGMFHRIGGPRPFTSAFYKLVGRLADRCLTYTRTGASNLVSLGVPKHKIGIVGTAIDERIPFAERAARTPEELAVFRREQGLEGRHVVLQVVRLSRLKRPELLVQAAQILLRQRQDLLFVLIGNGDMRQELEDMVAAQGLQQAFRFLGAVYDEAVLSRWYLSADVFVVPTCIGLSAHHAMSYGVPVVTDDSLDSQASEFDIIADGLNALTYREGDVASLAHAIERLTADSALRASLGANALRTVELRHNISTKAANFKQLNALHPR
jgi:glycosyltransferase involved in cell wall biosynthesis